MKEPIITLLTDFSESDPYVGAMKGVILSICPNAKLVDLSHQIEKHNIYDGAFYLFSAAKYYPKHAIHLVVIDPGVGSKRRPIIIESEKYYFVGPDNGVLSLAATSDKVKRIFEINNTEYFLEPVSDTFHGRDIFAPVAAHLALDKKIETFGTQIQDWKQIKIPQVELRGDVLDAEILHIDRFGNLISNIPRELFQKIYGLQKKSIQIKVRDKELKIPLCTSYNQVKIGDYLGIFGSTDFLEISRNQESAVDALGLRRQDKFSIKGI